MDPEEYQKKIEEDILKIIQERLEVGKMDADRARKIARLVLDKLRPGMSLEQIYEVVPTLDDEFTELASIVLPIAKERDEEIKQIVVNQVEKLIKSGRIGEASEILKKIKEKEGLSVSL